MPMLSVCRRKKCSVLSRSRGVDGDGAMEKPEDAGEDAGEDERGGASTAASHGEESVLSS